MGVQHYFNVIKLRMTDDFKSETCDRIGVRVLDRLLRDNPFTYLSVQCIAFVHNPFTYLSDTDGQEVGERFT